MSAERPSSIMCDICKSWHPTEAHAQYEKEAREKRMAEIKARPDSAYNFDKLGFAPEKKEEIEPWMHSVIEKAKDLGDDLQNSDFFLHLGPVEKGGGSIDHNPAISVFSFLQQPSFQESPAEQTVEDRRDIGDYDTKCVWAMKHETGESLVGGALNHYTRISDQRAELFVAQEKWVATRDLKDLNEYKNKILEYVPEVSIPELKYRQAVERLDNVKGYPTYTEDRKKMINYWERTQGDGRSLSQLEIELPTEIAELHSQWLSKREEWLNKLDDVEERKKVILRIQKELGNHYRIGIIFSINQSLQENFPLREDIQENSPGARYKVHYSKMGIGRTQRVSSYKGQSYSNQSGQEIIFIRKEGGGLRIVPNPQAEVSTAREFYREFIHGLFAFQGSVEHQREMLNEMMKITKDNPERRLPIYNFYGKLVWPRPPVEEKKQT